MSLKEIAEELGWTDNHIGVEIVNLRAAGFNLPHRHLPRERHAQELVRLWAEGKGGAEIAEHFGWSSAQRALNEVSRARRRGHDLPYRRPPRVAA